MYDTVYEFLLNSFIWIGNLHENKLRRRIANEIFYKIIKIRATFINEYRPC